MARRKPEPTVLLTLSGVAALKGCSLGTVHYAIARGDLKAVPIHGADMKVTTYAIRKQDAEAWTVREYTRRKKKVPA